MRNELLCERSHVETIKQAFLLFVVLSILTGIIYPLVITGIAQVVFPYQANGSLIYGTASRSARADRAAFDDPKYFWSRPSATRRCRTTPNRRADRTWGRQIPIL